LSALDRARRRRSGNGDCGVFAPGGDQRVSRRLTAAHDFSYRGLSALSAQDRADLLEILDDRIDTGSTLIASQLPVDTWHAYLGEPTLADAIRRSSF